MQIWPPKRIKDSGSRLHSKLKEDIMQTGMEKNLFGNHPVSLTATKSHVPLAIASDPLRRIAVSGGTENSNANASDSIKDPTLTSAAVEERNLVEGYSPMTGIGSSKLSATDIVEIDGPSLVGNQFISDHEPNFMKCTSPSGPGATTRKGAYHVDNQSSETQYYADDEDGTRKKYTRRESLGLLRSGDGCFSVKSLTSKLSSTGSANFPCKQIWNPVSPSKSNFLVWTMVLNKCLSKISLERKGLQLLSLLCGLCRLFPESTGHLSIHCPISSRVWEHFLTAAGICWVMPRSVKDLFSWKSACLKERGHLV
uniref:Reverse transcriptase zinc-binding domain-containing protein n=1 Tax=Nelumbo nucifera TaxID=4432 RepID=A0A822Z544_NELNU|nr:TPA_asm: hypothetical protein HUJ06_015807 [Nelumbo nucifera]